MPPPFESLARSFLFVPGARPDRFDKALASGAHAVIVDLEDAVAPAEKADAREHVAHWLREHPQYRVLLRVNAVGTPWHAEDMALARAPGVAAVVLPKAEKADDLPASNGKSLLPIIESAQGIDELRAIASHPDVKRLLFGTYDFRADLGLGDAPEALLPFGAQLVLASRLAGLGPPVDGVSADLKNEAAWVAEARRSRMMGFGGKLCIHPAQVACVNGGFAPTQEELSWARRVTEAMRDQATAVVDGQFVDKPVLLRAQALLAGENGLAVAAPQTIP